MSAPGQITLHAVVSPAERPALEAAAILLSKELTAAGQETPVCCAFLPSIAAIAGIDNAAGHAPIIVTSLLPELDNLAEPWPVAEQRLRAAYQSSDPDRERTVFVSTIFRYVARDHAAEPIERTQTEQLRVRIARLNLFAAELSRELGCNVIDIDRILADIGGRVLGTDYQLGGPYAVEAVAANVALTLLSLGLDAYATYEAQEAARVAIAARLRAWQNQLAPAHEMIRQDVISFGAGRRKQRVSMVINAVHEQHVSWLLYGVLTRRISLADAFAKLTQVIGRDGWRKSFATLFSGLVTLLRDRFRAQRLHP